MGIDRHGKKYLIKLMEEAKENYSEGYAKKLLTPKYIIGYVIVAAVLYGAVYYFFLRGNGYSANPAQYTAPTNNYQQQTPAPAPTTQTTTTQPWTINLSAQNGSGETGTAMLEDSNGQTKVTINLAGEAASADQPAHIHVGSCPAPGAVKYPLTNVVGGKSETTVNVSVVDLKSMGPFAINVHESAAKIGNYVACGDLK